MDQKKKNGRYERIYEQLKGLMDKTSDPVARMATVCAVLKNKLEYFFWCGFYRVEGEKLIVGPYQGPLACQVLQGGGVCLSSIQRNETIVVANVHEFPGHIACDSRSNSEIVVPLHDHSGTLMAVLDVDSLDFGSFDEIDALWLEKIAGFIYMTNTNV
jgi:L-methionine (R)-S-oxide reductase